MGLSTVLPDLKAPDPQAPDLKAPDLRAPDLKAPDLRAPDLRAPDLRAMVAAELEAGRRRSLRLLDPYDDAVLMGQHSPLMSPLVWDLAHVGNYEDLWLLRSLGGPGAGADLDDTYDASRHPRRDRRELALMAPAAARSYIASVRAQVLDRLAGIDLDPGRPSGELLADAFVYRMVIQHEHQHDETMLAALQMLGDPAVERRGRKRAESPSGVGEILVSGGTFVMGTSTNAWALDNERPAHQVNLPPFWIDTCPVTNHDWLKFVEAGGYQQSRWWTTEGWSWRVEADLEHPQFWRREGGSAWSHRRFGLREDLPLNRPVVHVCWYEADAYARWRGKRLPTEAEWERAATWDAASQDKRLWPWGAAEPTPDLANLGQEDGQPAPVGSYPPGASPCGAQQMVGDVWEWTASDFGPYPGFVAFPYKEYSEVFFRPGYKVLRGGSWATWPRAARPTFRNWDLPVRRQIFAGLRCARDA